MEDGGAGTSAAKRRRQRRLRSWWRHECQSVRMALNAAAHHSAEKVAAGEKNSGLRAQTSFSAGRPGVLEEPEPQGGAVTDGYVAAHSQGAGGQEEEQAEQEKVFQELDVLFRIPVDQLIPLQQRLAEHRRSGAVEAWRAAVWENRRKVVVKKRKKKLPKTSSHLSRGRARRRIRQCYVPGWSCWFSASHAVFPSFVGSPVMPGFMVGMDGKDIVLWPRPSSFEAVAFAG